MSSRDPPLSTSSVLGLQGCATPRPAFYDCSGDLNSVACTCAANTVLTEPSRQPQHTSPHAPTGGRVFSPPGPVQGLAKPFAGGGLPCALSQQNYWAWEAERWQAIFLSTAQAVINNPAHLSIAKGLFLFLKKIIVSTHRSLIILLPFSGCETGM